MARYTLKEGDNLAELAKKWGVTTSAILDANAGVGGFGTGVTLRIPTTTVNTGISLLGAGPPGGDPVDRFPDKDIVPPVVPPVAGPPGGDPVDRFPVVQTPPPAQPPVVRYTGAQPQPQPPVVRYTGAQPQTPYRNPAYEPPTLTGSRQSQVVPTVRYTGAQPQPPPYAPQPGGIQDRVMGYLNRLFSVQLQQRGVPRVYEEGDPVVGLTGAQRPEVPWYAPQPGSLQRNVYNVIQDPSKQSVANLIASAGTTAGDIIARFAGAPSGATGAPSGITDAEIDPETGHMTYRFLLADGTTPSRSYYHNMRAGDIGADGRPTQEAMDRWEQDVAENVGWSIRNRGEWPIAITEHSRRANGITREEMEERGYFQNPDTGVWRQGQPIGDEPQTVGAAMPYGGYGYGYGGYPGYSYPSGGGGTYQPYQAYANYVEGARRGQVPQQIQNRPARFGMVTWRI